MLAQRRDGAGKADRDRAVQQPDVDAQFECVGGGNAQQLALDESAFDVTSLSGCVAGAVGSEALGDFGVHSLHRETVNQLCGLPALREADRAQAAGDEVGHQLRCIAQRARAQTKLGVQQLRVPEQDRALGSRSSVFLDDGRLYSRDALRKLAGIGDRRRRHQELRLGSVHLGEATQTTQHVADVRTEHASVDMCLVDDDVTQVVQDVGPAIMVRQNADVEHVGVGENDIRPLPDLPATFARCVAVVDRRADVRCVQLGQCARLILGQRLCRIEIERPALGLAGDSVEDRKVEAK